MNEARDTLQSRATLTLLDLLGEGPIGGLVNGLQSVYFNDTPVQNPDGTLNFQGVNASWTVGDASQSVVQGFGNYIETPYPGNIQIKKTQPYTLTVANPQTDTVRIIMTLPALTSTNGDNGSIEGYEVKYRILSSQNNGPFTPANINVVNEFAGSWSLSDGYPMASVNGSVYTAMRVTVKASTNTYSSGWIDVQAQEYGASGWVNLGGVKRLAATGSFAYNASTEMSYLEVSSDSYSVETHSANVRFIAMAASSPSIFLEQVEIMAWRPTEVITISGKSRSRYQRAHLVPVTPGTNTKIRIERVSDDATSSLIQNETYLDSYSEIVSLNMVYPYSALFGIHIDSQQFNQIPNRAYLVDGLYIKVPVNYDPVTRTYSGVWNGTFKLAISNNPAWVMYDILTNTRYGLGQFISESQVDKAMLYTIGRYCDELVPNGLGGTEPRFTCNTVIGTQVEAYRVISDLASVFRGMGFWDGGTVSFTQDAPSDPVMLYSSANVIDGQFNYTGSARKDRHSVVHVTWNDPAENYKRKVEYVEDPVLVNQYGIRKLDTLAFGCTSRGQAARVGRWILYTERYESDFINFKVGMDSAFVSPGDIVKIHDTDRAGKRMAGRLVSCTATSATLDATITLTGGPVTISLMMPDGTFVDRIVVQQNGSFSTLTWGTALTTLPVANAMWMVSEPNLVPVLARVIGIAQSQKPGEFEITAVEHNPTKFAAIENGLTLQDRPTSIIDPSFVQTPTQITAIESRYLAAAGVVANRLSLSWFGNCTTHEVAWRGLDASNRSNWNRLQVTGALSYEIDNVALGRYEIAITGINPLGKRSATASTTYTVVGKITPPSDVTGQVAAMQTDGTLVYWQDVTDIDVYAYEVRLCPSLGATWEASTLVATVLAPRNEVLLPKVTPGTYQWLIKAIDLSGNYSATASRAQLVYSTPAAPTVSHEISATQIKMNWTVPVGSLPVDSYELRYGGASSTWATATSLGTVKGTTFTTPATWLGDRKFFVAAIDTAGQVGTAGVRTVTITAPEAPNVTSQVVDNNVLLFWTTPASLLPLDTYELRRGATWATATQVGTKTGNFTTVFELVAGTYTYWIAAIDVAGNTGTPSKVVTEVSQPPDYVLRVNSDLVSESNTPAGTFSNAARDVDGSYVLPVNATETFAQHFTARSWNSPDNQIAAGYPIFIQPALSPGYYEETIDYGTSVTSTRINVTVSGQVLAGSPTTQVDISVKLNAGDAWTDFTNTSSVFVTNFRYVKIRFTVTGTDTSLYRLTNLNARLDAKLRNDAGSGIASATDSVSGTGAIVNGVSLTGVNPNNSSGNRVPDGAGTLVRFNTPFVDISGIDVSVAAGSTARYGLYDFVDIANPAGFKVVLYDASGTRVGGSFSWSCKGY